MSRHISQKLSKSGERYLVNEIDGKERERVHFKVSLTTTDSGMTSSLKRSRSLKCNNDRDLLAPQTPFLASFLILAFYLLKLSNDFPVHVFVCPFVFFPPCSSHISWEIGTPWVEIY